MSSAMPALSWDNPESLKLLVESAPIAIVMVNHAGHILYVNVKLEEMFGYQRDELLGQPLELLLPERFRTIHQVHRSGYVMHPHVRSMGSGMDLAGRRKDGVEFPIEAGLSHIHFGDEMLILGSVTDITRRKQTEEELERRVEARTRELERRRQVADGLRGILNILNSNQSLNATLEQIVVQARELLNADACAIYSMEDASTRIVIHASAGLTLSAEPQANEDLDLTILGKSLAEGQPVAVTIEAQEGTRSHYCAQLAVPITLKQEVYGGLVLLYTHPRPFSREDIELAATVGDQMALAIENARLRTQVERTAVAAERNRIARDLHDSVTQTLFSASLIADVIPRLWDRNLEEGKRRIGELRELTRGALAEMRTLLLELRPATLKEVDLSDLLRLLADALTARARVIVNLTIQGERTLPPDVKVAFYHIAQEALNNVTKHARAQHVEIRLERHPEVVTLTIADDGCGFTIETIRPEHLGLDIMRERAESIGATLSIKSQPDLGTVVSLHW